MKSQFTLAIEMIHKKALEQELSLEDVFKIVGVHGHQVLIIFFCLPFMQPIPFPGLSLPFGIMISFLSLLLLLNIPPKIPQRWKDKKIPQNILIKTTEVADKFLLKVEKILEPRWFFLFNNRFIQIFNTNLVILNALLLAIPLPIPFSNTVPALVIVLNNFGHLEEDGVLVAISYVMTILSLAFFTAIALGATVSFF